MKKIILFVTFIITSISSSFAYHYVSTLPSNHNEYRGWEQTLLYNVTNYLNQHPDPSTISLTELRQIAANVFIGGGGWGRNTGHGYDNRNNAIRLEGGRLIIGCGNLDFGYFEFDNSVTERTVDGGSCSNYIDRWDPYWDNCIISSDWNSNGKIFCTQQRHYQEHRSSCGVEKITYTETCNFLGECYESETDRTCDRSSCPADKPRPVDGENLVEIRADLTNPISTCTGKYANNNDTCNIKVNIHGDTYQNKPIVGLVGTSKGNVTNITDTSGISSKIIGGSSYNALNFSSVNSNNIQGAGTNFYFTINGIKSYTPFNTNNGKISVKLGGVEMEISKINYYFLKPFIGYINSVDVEGNDVNYFKIGTKQTFKVSKTQVNPNVNMSNLYINNLKDTIEALPSDLYTVQFATGEIYDNVSQIAKVDATVNYKGDSKINQLPIVKIKPIISYNIDGVPVNYYLSPEVEPDINNKLEINGTVFIGIKIVGLSQGHGKQKLSGGPINMSNLSLSDVRNNIRRNAIKTINSFESEGIYNGIRYIIGDIKASEINNDIMNNKYETIVIENGNLIINENLNTQGKKLGIILIGNGVDNGNILVYPNVDKINAIIYADGSLISVDNNGNILDKDNVERNFILNKQLIINGRLIVKNTIGGALIGPENKYMLPGGKLIDINEDNFNKAMIYDLNYTRIGNNGGDKNGNNVLDENEYEEPLVIIYNNYKPKLFDF